MDDSNENIEKLPEEFRIYFWDSDFDKLDFNKYKKHIVVRLLTLGDLKEVKWIMNRIDKSFLREIINERNEMDDRTKNFWELMIDSYGTSS